MAENPFQNGAPNKGSSWTGNFFLIAGLIVLVFACIWIRDEMRARNERKALEQFQQALVDQQKQVMEQLKPLLPR
jgi:hypothetical protein